MSHLEERRRQVEAEKELFEQATPAERRVLIAKDVLAQIEAKHIRPAARNYYVSMTDLKYSASDVQLRDVFLSTESCGCCALGAAFICLIERENKVTYSHFHNNFHDAFFHRLMDLFGAQVHLIERYFEGDRGAVASQHAIESAVWVRQNPDPADRLIKIMQNIVDHEGTFVPEELK